MFYKALTKGGIGPYSKVKWNLPKDGEPGEWMPRVEEVVECKSGYHCCRRKDLIYWLREEIYEFEVRGHIYRYEDKCAVHQARLPRKMENWTQQTAHLFMADCAERVLPAFEKRYPNNKHMHKARVIVAVRQFVLKEISESELCVATHAHANADYAAADAATVYDNDYTAYYTYYAAYAAEAARAARVAAYVADDYEAERKWQTKTLFEYLDRPVKESLELAREKLRP